MKKIITIGIISIFLMTGLATISTEGRNIYRNKGYDGIVTVDDDRVECPDADYTHIQDAINDSDFCGGGVEKILVYPGIYQEDIIISGNKDRAKIYSVDGPEVTIIYGSGNNDVIHIGANWVRINGFTIVNGGKEYSGIVILGSWTGSWTYILNCVIRDNDGNGIVNAGSWAYILNCVIRDNDGNGIVNAGAYCTIYGNTISNNQKDGVVIESSFSKVENNVISNNNRGIYLDAESTWTVIYHNAFFNNAVNAYDPNPYNPYGASFGCNYWDDYTGQDSNNDNIGDTAYQIGDNNWDFYPSMVSENWSNIPPNPAFIGCGPFGGFRGLPHIPYTYIFSSDELDGDNIYYYIDWGDGSNSGWIGPNSDTDLSIQHTWKRGKFTIKVYVKDDKENEGWYYSYVEVRMGLFIGSQQSSSIQQFASNQQISLQSSSNSQFQSNPQSNPSPQNQPGSRQSNPYSSPNQQTSQTLLGTQQSSPTKR